MAEYVAGLFAEPRDHVEAGSRSFGICTKHAAKTTRQHPVRLESELHQDKAARGMCQFAVDVAGRCCGRTLEWWCYEGILCVIDDRVDRNLYRVTAMLKGFKDLVLGVLGPWQPVSWVEDQ